MSEPQAAQQVMIRLRAILDLYDDDDIAAGIRLLDEGSRASLAALAGPYLLGTKTGKVITPAEIEGWADEAERGYDVETVRAALRAQTSADFAPAPLAHSHDHRHAGGRYGIPGFRHTHPHEHARGSESHDHEDLHDSQGHSYATPPGYYRDESGLHRQHDVHGGPHDEPAPPPHPELGPLSGHQADGPADCRRCQLIRELGPALERAADADAAEFRDDILRARHGTEDPEGI